MRSVLPAKFELLTMMECLDPQLENVDVAETKPMAGSPGNAEWVDSLDYVLSKGGQSVRNDCSSSSPYMPGEKRVTFLYGHDSVPEHDCSRQQPFSREPGDGTADQKPGSLECHAMVSAPTGWKSGIGGHISTFASAAPYTRLRSITFSCSDDDGDRDVVIYQAATPGMYSRAYLEGRLSKEKLENFRATKRRRRTLLLPRTWLMPISGSFLPFYGLGPIQSIYHARFIRYLENRGLKSREMTVWAFMATRDGRT